MIKAFRTNFFLSQQQKKIEQAKINKTHEFIPDRPYKNLIRMLDNNKTKNQLHNIICKKMHSTDLTLKIKSLIVFHGCMRQKMDQLFLSTIIDQEPYSISKKCSKIDKILTEFNSYIKEYVINYYLVYLKKIAIKKQSYLFVKEASYQNFTHIKNQITKMQMIKHGFQIINLSNYILTSQDMFNKMGRYHLQFNQILNLYVQLLQDLSYFNSYIKRTVEYFIRDNVKSQKNYLQRSLQSVCVNGQIFMENQLSENQREQIKHLFLYIHQAQKISDRFYEYFHNRYYFRNIRKLIIIPSFLQITLKDFDILRNKAKRVDKNLCKMVKISKYAGNGSKCYTQGNLNQTSIGFKSQMKLKTFIDDFENTEVTSNQKKQKVYENVTVNYIDVPLFKKYQTQMYQQPIQQEVQDL